jgi:hypothetical protein
MARHKLQGIEILTGRTPNEVILTDELKDYLALRPEWVSRCAHWNPILHEERHKYRYGICPQCDTRMQVQNSLPKRFLSWLSELRYKGNKR